MYVVMQQPLAAVVIITATEEQAQDFHSGDRCLGPV